MGTDRAGEIAARHPSEASTAIPARRPGVMALLHVTTCDDAHLGGGTRRRCGDSEEPAPGGSRPVGVSRVPQPHARLTAGPPIGSTAVHSAVHSRWTDRAAT